MKRELKQLADRNYDLIVIGGGIYGAFAAWDAALRGLSVALVEKCDFGGATSSNSLKIVHGGFRYLQNADFKRMRESIKERTNLSRIAPHLVHPLKCIIPTRGILGKTGRASMSLALQINEIISYDRNSLTDPQKFLKRGHTVSKKICSDLINGISDDRLSGGAVWYDCLVYNTERLVISILHAAANQGLDLANYLEVQNILIKGRKIIGIEVKDRLEENRFTIKARCVLNAAGPWADKIVSFFRKDDRKKRAPLVKGMDLIVKRELFGKYAVGIQGRGIPGKQSEKRHAHYFFVPWRGCTMIGTHYSIHDDSPDELKVNQNDVIDFIDSINHSYPSARLRIEDVTFYHLGLLPSSGNYEKHGLAEPAQKQVICDHQITDGVEGMISIYGVKYTTARSVAEKAINVAFQKLGKKQVPCKTAYSSVYGGDISEFESFLAEQKKEGLGLCGDRVMTHLAYNYGSKVNEILKYLDDDLNLSQTVGDSQEVIRAEIINGIREEMAQKLSDIVLRRTDLGTLGHPGKKSLEECALIAAEEQDWGPERIHNELEEVHKLFRPIGLSDSF